MQNNCFINPSQLRGTDYFQPALNKSHNSIAIIITGNLSNKVLVSALCMLNIMGPFGEQEQDLWQVFMCMSQ
jgi:hypothetical protein